MAADPDVEMLFTNTDWNGSPCRVFTPTGLIQHLKVEGKECILLFGTQMSLVKLYGNDTKPTCNLQKAIDVGEQVLSPFREPNIQMETQLKTLKTPLSPDKPSVPPPPAPGKHLFDTHP